MIVLTLMDFQSQLMVFMRSSGTLLIQWQYVFWGEELCDMDVWGFTQIG